MNIKKQFIGIVLIMSLVFTASSQNELTTLQAEWKVPTGKMFKDINQEEYNQFIKNTYGDEITTTNINYIAKKGMYNFSLVKKDGKPFYRIKFSTRGNETVEELQKKAEYWANYWMIFEYKKTISKDEIGGLRFNEMPNMQEK